MDDFINVIKKDPQIRSKINNMLDRYIGLPFIYQSKRGFESLIRSVILKEVINIMGTTRTDKDIELKLKITRKKYLEFRLFYFYFT